MSKVINQVQGYEVECLEKCELLIDVTANINISTDTVFFHGEHKIDESAIDVKINSVELVIGGIGTVINLTKEQKQFLENNITIEL